jgi:hypothetical protein
MMPPRDRKPPGGLLASLPRPSEEEVHRYRDDMRAGRWPDAMRKAQLPDSKEVAQRRRLSEFELMGNQTDGRP